MRKKFIMIAMVLSLGAHAQIRWNQAYQQYIDDGAQPCITRTSDRGAENLAKNPRLVVWMDLNAQALTYWRDLGLTPSGLKKLDDQALKAKKRSSLAEALRDIG